MRNRLDNILLGTLWLLAATLGTSFWLNTKFGFNIFSAPHWQYLAYLQASKTPVAASFYISLGVAIFITIFGLYFLIQPKLRRIVLPIIKVKKVNEKPQPRVDSKPEPTNHKSDASEITIMPKPEQQPAQQIQPTPIAVPQNNPLRPPHLNLPTTNSYSAAPITQPATATNTSSGNDADNNAIREIFSQNGYIVKNNPYINRWRPNLLAIGTNEVLWIGAVGATTTQVRAAIDKLNQIFSDTLDDVYISINGFSINAPDAQTTESQDILLFNTINDLDAYMKQHPNSHPTAEEQENFDAYSEYIDTVIGYIGNL